MSIYDNIYVEEMKEAMMMLHEACRRNEYWNNCYQCPFDIYCDAMLRNDLGTPDEDGFINFERE